MQAGEINVQVQCYPYEGPPKAVPSSPPNLGGATCHLIVRSPYDVLTDLALIVSGDGTYAYRNTLATDFPVGGSYNVQMVAIYNDGTELKSPITELNVGWSLE